MYLLARTLWRPAALSLLLGFALPIGAQSVPLSDRINATAPKKVPRPAQSASKLAPAAVPVAAKPKDDTPWLFRGSDIPPDRDWTFGELPNGVRYAVRRNGVPPGQVSIRVRIDAGSLMESDTERGFAHLIEHLTFRGSAYVPDGEAKRIWQRLGTTFGSDTNAQTTPTGTTYKLDLPSATAEGLDESLKILSGMIAQPNLSAAALNAERPVVLAEQREQPGAQVRIGDTIRQTFFAGQPLADRSPIGTVKALEAATADSVQAFHKRWYRPDRTVVIISGDVDPAQFEALVSKYFTTWKANGPPPPEPDFGKPDPKSPIGAATNEPSLPPIVSWAVLRPWIYRDDTIIFNQKRMVDQMAVRLINRRLETRARGGGSYIQASVSLDDISRSANGTFISILPIGDDWEKALRDVRAVIADAQAAPPAQGEIDRELAEFDAAMKAQVDTARAEQGAQQADNMGMAIDIRETIASAQVSYDILVGAREKGFFTPEAILESTKRVFTGDATHAVVNARTADPTIVAKLEAALKADVSGVAATRDALKTVSFADLPKLGKPGKVVRRLTAKELKVPLEVEQIEFGNGVRAMLYPNKGEANRVYVRVRFGGGINALPTNRQTMAWAAPLALVSGGIGKLGQEELDQLTVGRRIGLGFGIENDAFSLSATTSPEDLADQLTLIAAKLAAPGWDQKPIARARAVTLAAFDANNASPGGVLSRDLEGLLHNGDPRWTSPTRAQVEASTPAMFKALWAPLLASGPIEVQVFGDFKTEETIVAIAKSVGALAPRRAAKRAAPPVAFPAITGKPIVLTHEGPDNQAVAVVAWPTGGGIEGVTDSRRLDLLAQIFSDRLFDRLRSEAGASYSPSVQNEWPLGLPNGGRMIAVGQVPPDKVEFFYKLVREIAADLVAKPIDRDELRRTLVPYLQYIARASTGNTFWLNQLESGAFDPRRLAAVNTIAGDLQGVTPEVIQATAQKYLKADGAWLLQVVPKAGGTTAGK
ncbi:MULTISPECIES: pitrilysin family protein [unclassified Sphingomonas]|uniref:M16 family metallopeptidase n=1 Tax=unclassified Sphingomonas TaxID=196159 RepID=UPI000BD2E66A|nr:MAG: peptidase M16 [Sphingomonas sp. 12-62-6]OYX37241.1 MAG: peptidase M16 [Sphingomonas sp. 32-62-10]